MKFDWGKLNPLQLGRYAEYFAKMEFTLLGFDVYEPEVDDKGIDFIIRKDENKFYEIQVKSNFKGNYIFMEKSKFILREGLYLVLVLFTEGKSPELYLIPSTAWKEPNELFVSMITQVKRASRNTALTCPKRTSLNSPSTSLT